MPRGTPPRGFGGKKNFIFMPKRDKKSEKANKVTFVSNGTAKHLGAGVEKQMSRSQAERLESRGYGEIKKGKK